ncbi:MAG: 23S rRNA (adenine(2503)-C(2))-methyltransferase RlmN [Bacteroidetes bacterium]|nr:23S rRNA (adenine(2503)-C(2))-methyltransferase RlmN [Bacteroidota bacterium]MBU1720249.1 23S rRNA (adenine(2503)-C(2))-methyltransferase RlmN [Bacteroidota bacterium]
MNEKTDIRQLIPTELEAWFEAADEKKFRVRQLLEWMWTKGINDFNLMTNFSVELRNKLTAEFDFQRITLINQQISADKTVKAAFRCYDNQVIEAVLIPSDDRVTVCISVQTGCKMGCTFCATGLNKQARDLTFWEIFEQVAYSRREASLRFGAELSNIVVMGMGEPFMNYENLTRAISLISGTPGFGMSPSRITVSTVGIPDMILRAADEDAKFNLAFSLHASTDAERNKIIPINKKHKIDDVIDALKYFQQQTGGDVTFEYLMLNGVNDSPDDLKRLISLCCNFRVKVNLIPYNIVPGLPYKSSSDEIIDYFVASLSKKGIIAIRRKSRGSDIAAACGQLAGTGGKSY